MLKLKWFRRNLTAREKAERASRMAVPTQAIGHVRARKRRATINGLMSALSDEAQARVAAKLDQAARAGR